MRKEIIGIVAGLGLICTQAASGIVSTEGNKVNPPSTSSAQKHPVKHHHAKHHYKHHKHHHRHHVKPDQMQKNNTPANGEKTSHYDADNAHYAYGSQSNSESVKRRQSVTDF